MEELKRFGNCLDIWGGIFVGILLVASVGVFFTWTPIWFLFGLIFPAFNLTNKKEQCIANSNINSTK